MSRLARRFVRRTSLAWALPLALAAWACRPAASPAPEAPPAEGSVGPPAAEESGAATDQPAPPSAGPVVFAVFQGDLPCSDCAGIRTRLTLFAEGDRYRLEETRLGVGARARTIEGTWTTLRGSADDPDATVYVLDPRDPKRERNFLRLGESAVEQLDRDQRRLRPPERYRLARADVP